MARKMTLFALVAGVLMVACDRSAPAAPPAVQTSTAVAPLTPGTGKPSATPTGVVGGARQSGIADVDAILGAVAVRNVDALLTRIALQAMACVDSRTQGAGGPIRCGAGVPVGSLVKAFPTSTCEGDWNREPDLRAMMTQWLDGVDLSRGVYGVVRGPSIARSEPYMPIGDYWAVYPTKQPATGPGAPGQAKVVVIEGGKIVSLRFGCTLTPADELTYRGSPLPVVLPPLP